MRNNFILTPSMTGRILVPKRRKIHSNQTEKENIFFGGTQFIKNNKKKAKRKEKNDKNKKKR